MPPPRARLASRRDWAPSVAARRSARRPCAARRRSTTTRPPTSSVSTSGRGPSTSAATGSAIPAWSTSSSRHSAMSASLPGSSEPISASRPRQRAPWIVPSSSASRAVSARGPRPASRASEQRLAQLAAELARLVGGGAVDARARPARRRRRAPGRARCPRRAARWSSGSARRRCASRRSAATSCSFEVDAVGEPDVVAEPPELLEVLDGPAAEQLEAEALLVLGLGHVGVQPHAARSRASVGRLAHQLLRDAERGARRERDPHHRVRRGVVVAVDRVLRRGEDRVAVLDHLVRRQAAVGAAEVHRAAARMEAQPDLAGGLDLDREQVAGVAREEVVVVGGGACSPSARARRARRGRRRARSPRRRAPRPDRAPAATRTASPPGRARAWPTGRGGGGS